MTRQPAEVSGILFLLRVFFQVDRRRAYLLMLGAPVAAGLTQLYAFWISLATGAALSRNMGAVTFAATGIAATLICSVLVTTPLALARTTFADKVAYHINERTARLSGGLPTLESFADSDFLDRIALIEQRKGSFGGAIVLLPQVLASSAAVLTMALLLATVRWWLVAIPLCALPALIANKIGQRRLMRAQQLSAVHLRSATAAFETIVQPASAKEVRVQGKHTALLEWQDVELRKAEKAARDAVIAVTNARGAAWAVSYLGMSAFLFAALRLALTGDIGPEDIGLIVIVISQVLARITELGQLLAAQGDVLATARHLVWLEGYFDRNCTAVSPQVRRDRGLGIGLDRASYTYPDAVEPAVRNVTVWLPAGQVVAVVGDNGSGKSTLVRLLLGLAQPSTGALVLGAHAAPEGASPSARDSMCAQDFSRFEFSIRRAVGCGDTDRQEDVGVVRGALAEVGANEWVDAFPAGVETQLGRHWTGGHDLSSGQWQQLAVARAAMREAPRLVALDEPTASIDAVKEARLFSQIADGLFARASRGSSVLVVAHRLSLVRNAHTIVVMHAGEVVEVGSHGELMHRGGRYAEMFRTQQRAYA